MLSNGQTYLQFSIGAEFKNFPTDSWLMCSFPKQKIVNIDSLKNLKGGFSGVYLHKMRFTAELYRDTFGLKPLFYSFKNDLLVASNDYFSVLCCQSQTPEPNKAKIQEYLKLLDTTGAVNEETFFEGIYRVLPGQKAEFNMNGSSKTFFDTNPQINQSKSHSERFKAAFISSVKELTHAHQNLAANLSGGLDSSSICSVIAQQTDKELNGIYFDAGITEASESNYAHAVSVENDFDLHQVKASDNFLNDLRLTIKLTCQPEQMVVPCTIFLPIFKIAKNLKAKLLLSGHGGDNVVETGRAYLNDLFKRRNFFELKEELYKNYQNQSRPIDFEGYFIQFIRHQLEGNKLLQLIQLLLIKEVDKKVLFKFLFNKLSSNTKDQELRLKTHAEEIKTPLAKVKANSKLDRILESCHSGLSIHSLEILETLGKHHGLTSAYPFLNKQVVYTSAEIENEINYAEGQLRGTLRESMKGILPEIVRNRSTKAAFTGFALNCLIQLSSELRDQLQKDHKIWNYVSRSSFDQLLDDLLSEETEAKNRNKTILECIRVFYLAIWLDTFYSS
ncbi:asparagine synthase-related protein [Jiulongibacter sp. NS-SX5]|uniref:asparagine synthase-related protein n=1 Tax=Jiulongibacter sp. NS-SX5 TaxID=3463854 RepID=UPI004058775C